ncbi:MAG: hypothetical protein KRP56_01285 [Candidatus Methanogranum gryphiswaldense]|nr:MAG: hypothetical protein KRP56_01285 [Candidatus Methanogranum sp. U3.2.1]
MVNACPAEGDPRLVVEKFVSDSSLRTIAGLREEGTKGLIKIVREEVLKQDPSANIILLDRDSTARYLFPRELTFYIESMCGPDRNNVVLIPEELSMNGWQHSFSPLIEKGYKIQVYFASSACRQVPICSKLF